MNGAIDFLLAVWELQRQKRCWFALCSKHRETGKWKDHMIRWPCTEKDLEQWFESHSVRDYNLYFCPLPFSKPKRRIDNVLGSRLLWSDMDEADPDEVDPRPQIAWESSPGRHAGLWIVDKELDSDAAASYARGLAYSIGADRSGWDLTQVLRIPFTRNHKYPSSPRGRLRWFKDGDRVDLGKIDTRVNRAGKNARKTRDDERGHPARNSALSAKAIYEKYAKKFDLKTRKLLTAKEATVGKRSDVLWFLENRLLEAGLRVEEIIALVKESVWNKYRGRRDEDERLEAELEKIAEEAGHGLEDEPDHDEGPQLAGLNGHPAAKIVRMSDVQPESVGWIWYPYIPRGKLTILEGDPGLGKSWISLSLATHLSRRKRLPGSKKLVSGRVLLMSAEDGLGDTIRPRLDSMKANVDRIFAHETPVTLDDDGLQLVDEQITELKPVLVVIDPLVAYMGGNIDLHKANETRTLMSGLAVLAAKHNAAIVAVRHLRKGGADRSIYRGIGSIDLTAAARSVLMVGPDPDDADSRAVCHIKSNLAPIGPTLQYSLVKGKFRWEGTTELTAADIMKPESGESGKERSGLRKGAEDWLRAELADAPEYAQVLMDKAETRGFSKSTLTRAKDSLGVKAYKDKFGGGWKWKLVTEKSKAA